MAHELLWLALLRQANVVAEVAARWQLVAGTAGEDGQRREGFKALEQPGELDVGIAVVGIRDAGSLAEEGVGLVEDEDGAGRIDGGEEAVEVLLGLAHVLRRDGG